MKSADKTVRMQLIEAQRGSALEELIPNLYNQLGSLQRVAVELEIDTVTLINWNKRLGISIRTERIAELAS